MMTASEAARRLNVSRETVGLICREYGVAKKLGPAWMISDADCRRISKILSTRKPGNPLLRKDRPA